MKKIQARCSLRSKTPVLCTLFPPSPGRSVISQSTLRFSGTVEALFFERVASAESSSCRRPACPGFIPALNGVTNGAGAFLLGPVPSVIAWVGRVGVDIDVNAAGEAINNETRGAEMGVEASGCGDPAVINERLVLAGRPPGLRGDPGSIELLTAEVLDNNGDLKGFEFRLIKSTVEVIGGWAGREKLAGVGVLGEFWTVRNACRGESF